MIKFDGSTANVVATGNLSVARGEIASTKIHVNEVDYIIFAGG